MVRWGDRSVLPGRRGLETPRPTGWPRERWLGGRATGRAAARPQDAALPTPGDPEPGAWHGGEPPRVPARIAWGSPIGSVLPAGRSEGGADGAAASAESCAARPTWPGPPDVLLRM